MNSECSHVIPWKLKTTYLLKLVDPKYSPCVSTMWSNLLSETRGVAAVLDGQFFLSDPFVPMEGSDWLFWRGYQVFLIYTAIFLVLASLSYNLMYKENG